MRLLFTIEIKKTPKGNGINAFSVLFTISEILLTYPATLNLFDFTIFNSHFLFRLKSAIRLAAISLVIRMYRKNDFSL